MWMMEYWENQQKWSIDFYSFNFFFQAEDGIRDRFTWLEFRRVLFRSQNKCHVFFNALDWFLADLIPTIVYWILAVGCSSFWNFFFHLLQTCSCCIFTFSASFNLLLSSALFTLMVSNFSVKSITSFSKHLIFSKSTSDDIPYMCRI